MLLDCCMASLDLALSHRSVAAVHSLLWTPEAAAGEWTIGLMDLQPSCNASALKQEWMSLSAGRAAALDGIFCWPSISVTSAF